MSCNLNILLTNIYLRQVTYLNSVVMPDAPEDEEEEEDDDEGSESDGQEEASSESD